MIKALDDFGIEKLTIMANEIYDTGKIQQDLSKSIFIALPKKPGTIECELHRTISLIWAHSRPRKSLANLAKSPNFL